MSTLNIATRTGPRPVESLGELTIYGARCFAHRHPDDCENWFSISEYLTGRELDEGPDIPQIQEKILKRLNLVAKKIGSTPEAYLAGKITENLQKGGAVN